MSRPRAELSVVPPPALLDEPGKAIVRALQADGRRSYTAIAAEVGLSEAAVRARVKGLLESGVVRIAAITDPLQLGFGMMAMIGISVSGDTREVADELAAIDEIDYIVLTSGRFDIMIEIICRDNEHLLTLLNDRIRAVSGVRETETFVSLRVHKETYTWGTA